MARLKILSLNCRGLKNEKKRKSIFNICKQYDIVCIQESHIIESVKNTWEIEWGGKLIASYGSSRSKGQLVLLNKYLKFENLVLLQPSSDRVLAISFCINNIDYKIINIYGPSEKNERHALLDLLSNFNFQNTILCGDFNIVMSNDLDVISGDHHNLREINNVEKFILDHNLVDVWRFLNNEKKEFTWSRPTPFIARRLDYMFVCNELICKIDNCAHIEVPFTDHKGVSLIFKPPDTAGVGNSLWKFNESLLQDEIYVNLMNTLIDDFIMHSHNMNPNEKWDLLKAHIKSFSISYSIKKSKERKKNETTITNELEKLEAQLSLNPHDETTVNRILS